MGKFYLLLIIIFGTAFVIADTNSQLSDILETNKLFEFTEPLSDSNLHGTTGTISWVINGKKQKPEETQNAKKINYSDTIYFKYNESHSKNLPTNSFSLKFKSENNIPEYVDVNFNQLKEPFQIYPTNLVVTNGTHVEVMVTITSPKLLVEGKYTDAIKFTALDWEYSIPFSAEIELNTFSDKLSYSIDNTLFYSGVFLIGIPIFIGVASILPGAWALALGFEEKYYIAKSPLYMRIPLQIIAVPIALTAIPGFILMLPVMSATMTSFKRPWFYP